MVETVRLGLKSSPSPPHHFSEDDSEIKTKEEKILRRVSQTQDFYKER